MTRLDKFLAGAGAGTRSEVKAMIKKGMVTVDGGAALNAGARIPETAEVRLAGKKIAPPGAVYLLMNKPPGVISAVSDPSGRERTVTDILPEEYKNLGLFPAGRLDKDTVGLLILTNDGAFAHSLTSPRKKIIKTYYAVLSGPVTDSDIAAFAGGLTLGDGYVCAPAGLAGADGAGALVEITEGKYHQVKRMFQAVGKTVLFLKRIKIGEYELPADLPEGEVRKINNAERL